MTKPKLKGVDCVDHDPIEQWQPDDDTAVSYQLCLHLGPADETGADLFYVHVTSSEIASARVSDDAPRQLVVAPYSWANVVARVETILNDCAGDSWQSQAAQLARYFDWEYADYRA